MEIAALVKLLALGMASTLVGTPFGPTPETFEVPTDTTGSGSGGSGGGGSGSYGSDSNAQPANKIAAAGTTVEHMTNDMAGRRVVTLFDEMIKVSGPSDLLIEVNAECALWTEVIVVDDDDSNTPEVDVPASESEARVKVWVTIDDVDVLVTEQELDDGKVVFCDRVHGMTLRENEGDDDNETISNYLRTRTANSFAWIALNAGDYPGDGLNHHVEVFAELDAAVNMGEGSAEAAVGKRTLIVEPVMMANNEQV